jgi:hypothetical protein
MVARSVEHGRCSLAVENLGAQRGRFWQALRLS